MQGFGLQAPVRDSPRLINVCAICQGIGLKLNRHPVVLEPSGRIGAQCAVAIETGPYMFFAGGYYNDHIPRSKASETTRSLFVSAGIQGTIAVFEFASIDGLQEESGYNAQNILPTTDQKNRFPYIASDPRIGGLIDILLSDSTLLDGLAKLQLASLSKYGNRST